MDRRSPPFSSREDAASRIGTVLSAVRKKKPRIHAITNPVAQNLTANGLLALGATPSLTLHPPELDAFIASADAALLNLGMLDAARFEALPLAVEAARAHAKPFVLDPVFAERSPARRALARAVITTGPAIIKANQNEAAAFAGDFPPGATILITGASDHLRQGRHTLHLANGHPLLAQVTATGCLLGAILAACLAVESDPLAAALAGVSILNIAAELAAGKAQGPGTFAPHLLDALAALTADDIATRLNLEFS